MKKIEEIVKRLDSANNLAEVFFDFAKAQSEKELFSQSRQVGLETTKRVWESQDYATTQERVSKVANYLKSVGVKNTTAVAIISNTRPEWLEADFAILALGGVSVSVYQSLIAEEIAYILLDSGSEFVFAENQEQVNKLLEIHQKDHILPATADRVESKKLLQLKKIITFESCSKHPLVISFTEIMESQNSTEPVDYRAVKREQLASLVYTSGTTGVPKGVMQTHHNHLSNVRQVFNSGLLKEDTDILLFLPLAHSFAKLLGLLGFLSSVRLKFVAIIDKQSSKVDPISIARDMREANAQVVPVVPRLLEKMKDGVLHKTRMRGAFSKLLKLTVWSAAKCYKARIKGKYSSPLALIAYSITSPLRKKIRTKLFGNNFYFALSGGAKLDLSVIEFFEALGMSMIQGYGLTETCVATNANRPGQNKPGTVGPVLDDDIELKIAEDGEIIYRGPNIALGYYNMPTATAESWDSQGWFYTGDLGSIDSDGYLSIVGRKKELIVSSNGKKIPPYPIEEQLKNSPYILNAVLIGNDRSYCVALVVIDIQAIKNWLTESNISDQINFLEDERVFTLIWQHVQEINKGLSNYESVKRIALISEDFTIENGLLTPTFKIKRKKIEERYANEIKELYGS